MSKVRNFSEITPNIAFPEFNFYELYYSTFEKSELGRITKLLPLREMAENFGLVRKSMRPKLGRKSFFTPDGKVALMFLRMYTGLSCPKLLEQLNDTPILKSSFDSLVLFRTKNQSIFVCWWVCFMLN